MVQGRVYPRYFDQSIIIPRYFDQTIIIPTYFDQINDNIFFSPLCCGHNNNNDNYDNNDNNHLQPGCVEDMRERGLELRVCDGTVDCPDFSGNDNDNNVSV